MVLEIILETIVGIFWIFFETFTTPLNLIVLLWVIFQLAFWWSARKWQSVEMVRRRAIYLSPAPTQFLQKHFRSKAMDVITSHIWFWGFVVAILLEMAICGLQGKYAWRYGLPIMVSWTTSMLTQLLLPVVVPIRWQDFGRANPVETIRFGVFKKSDNVNGLLYNGLPSNHLGLMISGFFLCLLAFARQPLLLWLVLALIFVCIAVTFSWSVIYLGEHYIHDLVASCLLFPIVMLWVFFLTSVVIPW